MSADKKDMPMWLQVAIGSFAAFAVYGLIDRFVLSRVYNHLENLIDGTEDLDEE